MSKNFWRRWKEEFEEGNFVKSCSKPHSWKHCLSTYARTYSRTYLCTYLSTYRSTYLRSMSWLMSGTVPSTQLDILTILESNLRFDDLTYLLQAFRISICLSNLHYVLIQACLLWTCQEAISLRALPKVYATTTKWVSSHYLFFKKWANLGLFLFIFFLFSLQFQYKLKKS